VAAASAQPVAKQSSGAPAASAEANSQKEDTQVSDSNVQADAKGTPPIENPPTPAPQQQPTATPASAVPTAPALNMSAEEIRNLQDLCAIAQMPAALSDFIGRNITFAAAKQELMAKRAAAGGPEIQSQVLPDVGTKPTGTGNPNSLIEACKRRAKSMFGGRS
jgi:hypothetical protein